MGFDYDSLPSRSDFCLNMVQGEHLKTGEYRSINIICLDIPLHLPADYGHIFHIE